MASLSSRAASEQELRRQMPPLQTASLSRTSTAPSNPHPSAKKASTTETVPEEPSATSPTAAATAAGHRRFVLTDAVAARYLEDDPKTTILARRQKIEGYETYLVEQWACSRSHPTFLITTYTGNPADAVLASIISVPADQAEWSPQMRLFFTSLTQYHARPKETAYGTLMITNLSGFPSSLTVIPIPGGDLKKYREVFFVNENLKRLGCSGRLGIKLAPPSSATEAKFHQLYRTSEKIPFNASVIELVKLCQVALVLFGTLEPEYADGLLCDVTEKALNDWWLEHGAEYYTVEPHDGILGPTTVAALLGMLMGARNRLNACNAPVAKDVFDVESTKRGIAHFQKSQHLPRTRRLDRQTLDKLRRATAKAASKEGWAVPRAFKSTVAELGGKGGEMVMGIVGAGQKDGIAEVETVDIDQFVELVRGEHAKWLWHGKPRKSAAGDMFSRLPGEQCEDFLDDHESSRKSLSRETNHDQLTKRENTADSSKRAEVFSPDGTEKDKDKDLFSRRAAIKAIPGSGFRHIKDAVGLRTHASKLSREENHHRHGLHRSKSDIQSPQLADASGAHQILEEDQASFISSQRTLTDTEPAFTKVLTESPHESTADLMLDKTLNQPRASHEPSALRNSVADSDASTHQPLIEDSVADEIYHGVELNEILPIEEAHEVPPLLRRTLSSDQLEFYQAPRHDDWWPRQLSFSIAEENVLRWRNIANPDVDEEPAEEPNNSGTTLQANLALQNLQSEQLKRLHHRLALLSSKDTAWVTSCITDLTSLEADVDADIETLDSIYYPRLDTYHELREEAHAITTTNRSQLNMSVRELCDLGDKLEYEIGALRSKVEDVEDALLEFERQVEQVEGKAEELDRVLGKREGWCAWAIRIGLGIGA